MSLDETLTLSVVVHGKTYAVQEEWGLVHMMARHDPTETTFHVTLPVDRPHEVMQKLTTASFFRDAHIEKPLKTTLYESGVTRDMQAWCDPALVADLLIAAHYLDITSVVALCCAVIGMEIKQIMTTKDATIDTMKKAYPQLNPDLYREIIGYVIPSIYKLMTAYDHTILDRCLSILPFTQLRQWVEAEWPLYLEEMHHAFNPFSALNLNEDPEAVQWILDHPLAICMEELSINPSEKAVDYLLFDSHVYGFDIMMLSGNRNPRALSYLFEVYRSYKGPHVSPRLHPVIDLLVLVKNPAECVSAFFIEQGLVRYFQRECSLRNDHTMVTFLIDHPEWRIGDVFYRNTNPIAIRYNLERGFNADALEKIKINDMYAISLMRNADIIRRIIQYTPSHYIEKIRVNCNTNAFAMNPHEESVRYVMSILNNKLKYRLFPFFCNNEHTAVVNYVIQMIEEDSSLDVSFFFSNPNPIAIDYCLRHPMLSTESNMEYFIHNKNPLVSSLIMRHTEDVHGFFLDKPMAYYKDTEEHRRMVQEWCNSI